MDNFNISSIMPEELSSKLQQYEIKLNQYKKIKERQHESGLSSNALSMEALLSKEVKSADLIDSDTLSCLQGDHGNFILVEGDLYLEYLDLDKLIDKVDGLIVEGNLTIFGGIYNLIGDYGPALIVSGDVYADYLIAGGSEIYLHGKTHVHGFIVGHYNHGMLVVKNGEGMIEINSEHFSGYPADVLFMFADLPDEGQVDISYLAKLFSTSEIFASYINSGRMRWCFDIDVFNTEIINNDIALLEAIYYSFLEKEKFELHCLDARKTDELEAIVAILETNAMEPVDLLSHAEITRCSMRELNFDGLTLPIQGRDFLEMLRAYIVKNDDCNEVILAKDFHVSGDLKLERKAKSYSWRSISAFYIDGDMTIEGDLLNDCADTFPLLIVKGDLILRSWLRGGMIAFIGGSVRASGVLVCEYNDGGLFVGGDLIAEGGFIHGIEPYRDMPDVQPHQIRGDIQAKSFDSKSPNITDEQILSTFVTEVLEDVGHCYLQYDPYKIIKRVAEGLSIWRE